MQLDIEMLWQDDDQEVVYRHHPPELSQSSSSELSNLDQTTITDPWASENGEDKDEEAEAEEEAIAPPKVKHGWRFVLRDSPGLETLDTMVRSRTRARTMVAQGSGSNV